VSRCPGEVLSRNWGEALTSIRASAEMTAAASDLSPGLYIIRCTTITLSVCVRIRSRQNNVINLSRYYRVMFDGKTGNR